MICPGCGQQPLSLTRFLLKPQVLGLECARCGMHLKMPAACKCLFAAWVLMTIAVLRFGTSNLPLPRAPFWTPKGLLIFVATIIVPAALLALAFRLIAWQREYLPSDSRPRISWNPSQEQNE